MKQVIEQLQEEEEKEEKKGKKTWKNYLRLGFIKEIKVQETDNNLKLSYLLAPLSKDQSKKLKQFFQQTQKDTKFLYKKQLVKSDKSLKKMMREHHTAERVKK